MMTRESPALYISSFPRPSVLLAFMLRPWGSSCLDGVRDRRNNRPADALPQPHRPKPTPEVLPAPKDLIAPVRSLSPRSSTPSAQPKIPQNRSLRSCWTARTCRVQDAAGRCSRDAAEATGIPSRTSCWFRFGITDLAPPRQMSMPTWSGPIPGDIPAIFALGIVAYNNYH